MAALKLTRKPQRDRWLNLRGVVPDRLQPLSLAELKALPIGTANGSTVTLESEFEIEDGDRLRIELDGDLRRCDGIAGDMRAGELVAHGPVGNYLADGMSGGRAVVEGDAGWYAASGMRGGQLTIRGDVGRYAAAAPPAAARGMNGGEVLICGAADEFLASRMRRGRVVVWGDVAAGCATRMIAGTLVLCGQVQSPLGCGMARGTLLLLGSPASWIEASPPGFTAWEACELSFLQILISDALPHLPVPLRESLQAGRWLRSLGDRSLGGQGELLLRPLSLLSPGEPWLERDWPV